MIFFYKKKLCIVVKLAFSQPPIARLQSPILESQLMLYLC